MNLATFRPAMRLSLCILPLMFLLPFSVPAQKITPEQIHRSAMEWLNKKAVRPMGRLQQIQNGGITAGSNCTFDEQNITQTTEPESEVHAAINPTDTNNIVVSAMRWEPFILGVQLALPIYYTRDFGQSWQLSAFDPTGIFGPLDLVLGGGDPVLAFDPSGRVHFSWLIVKINLLSSEEVSFAILHATSEDGGATWAAGQAPVDESFVSGDLTSPQIILTGRAVDKEWMAVDRNADSPHYGNLYLTYIDLHATEEVAYYRILLRTWREGAGFGETTIAVDSVGFFLSQFVTPVVDTRGALHLFWLGVSSEDFYLGVYHARSDDGGTSFSEPVLVSYVNVPCFPPMSSTEPCIPGIDPDRTQASNFIIANPAEGPYENELYAVWAANGFEDAVSTEFDIYFSRSTDGGANWSLPIPIDRPQSLGAHSFMPAMTITPEGVLSISWYSQGQDTSGAATHYHGVLSEDGGRTFSEEFQISCLPSDFNQTGLANGNFGVGEYNASVATSHYVLPFWADGRNNNGNLEIYFARVPVGPQVPTAIRPLSLNGVDMKASPNPTSGPVRLTLELEAGEGAVGLLLFAPNGQLVKTFLAAGSFTAGNHILELDFSGLSPGTYFLALKTERGNLIQTIAVN